MTRAAFARGALAIAIATIAARGDAQEAESAPPESPPPAAVAAIGAAGDPEARFELFARGGYVSTPVSGGITPFGLGGGGGIALAVGPVYVGASVVDYLGGKDDTGSSEHALLYGAEVGYEIKLHAQLTLRPFVGAGGASITHSIPTTSASTSATGSGRTLRDSSAVDVVTQATSVSGSSGGVSGSSTSDTVVNTVYVEPGVALILAAPSGTFVGLRGSALYFPHVDYGSGEHATWLPFAAHLTIGQRF